MRSQVLPGAWALVLAAGLAGCGPGPATTPPKGSAQDEAAVRAAFAELQQALQARDGGKLWALLAEKSRAEAEQAGLTGVSLLDHKEFQKKYHEVPESKVESVTVHGEDATVRFVEPDGDHEKLTVIRQGGGWKLVLKVPKVPQKGGPQSP